MIEGATIQEIVKDLKKNDATIGMFNKKSHPQLFHLSKKLDQVKKANHTVDFKKFLDKADKQDTAQAMVD